MKKYAQIMSGKIIYFYHTDLEIGELSKIFSPNTYWIDVTDLECALGWEVTHDAECKIVLTPPKVIEETLEETKSNKLQLVKKITASKITGGFVSTCYNGENILYDTDTDTQITMTFAKNCCEGERFAQELPNGLEVRGYKQVDVDEDGTLVFSKDKTIFYFNPEQIKTWNEDFALFLRECKKQGWMKQAEVEACTTKEELAKVKLDW